MKDKLIKLIEEKQIYGIDQAQKNNRDILLLDNEELADHLISNGVVVIDTDAVSAENRPLISTLAGYPINEVIDLMQVKQEGRVIVTPCKVGSTLYKIVVDSDSCEDCNDFYCAYEYGETPECENEKAYPLFPSVKDYLNNECCPKHTLEIAEYKFSTYHLELVTRELGKTVFLTREEAEKALADITNKKS